MQSAQKNIFFPIYFFPLYPCVKYFCLTLKKGIPWIKWTSLFFLFFFIDLSSSLNRSFSLFGSFPSFLFPLSPAVSFPLFFYPPVPSFHPKRKWFFLVNLSSWNKKKITPPYSPPLHTPSKIRGYVGIPPSHFFSFFSGLPNPFEFFAPFSAVALL